MSNLANIQALNDYKLIKNGSSNYYVLDFYDLMDVQKFLMSADFLDGDIKLLFQDANQYVISCRLYPFSITRKLNTNNSKIIIGNGIEIKKLGTTNTIYGDKITSNLLYRKKIATINFQEYFNSFLDYEPYTKIQIYLPYFDFVDLDVNLYMNKTMEVWFEVDFASGTCMYAFIVDDNVIETHNGRVGIDIPLSQTNASEIARNHLLNILNASKNVVGIQANYDYKQGLHSTSKNLGEYRRSQFIQTGIGSVTDFINANQKHFQKSSQPSGYLDFTKPQNIFLIISRPNIQIPSDYAHLKGIPSAKTNYLYDLKGYTEVEEINLDRLSNATENEKNEIENLLKTGVIL